MRRAIPKREENRAKERFLIKRGMDMPSAQLRAKASNIRLDLVTEASFPNGIFLQISIFA